MLDSKLQDSKKAAAQRDSARDTDDQVQATARRGWIDWLHIAGSVASVTGISLLALNKTFSTIRLSEIVAYSLVSLIVIALLMVVIRLLFLFNSLYLSRIDNYWKAVYWLLALPISFLFCVYSGWMIYATLAPGIEALFKEMFS